eukprot:2888248-Amphidinium_carterae.2
MTEFNGAIGFAPDEPTWSSLFVSLFRGPLDGEYGDCGAVPPTFMLWPDALCRDRDGAAIGACTDLALSAIVTGVIPAFVSFFLECLPGAPFHQPGPCLSGPLGSSIAAWAKGRPSGGRSQFPTRRCPSFNLKVTTFNCRSLLEQGKLVFVADRMKALGTDIACIQETRLRDKFELDAVGEYRICSSPAEPHRGGLMILHRIRPGIEIIEHSSTSTRVLRATFRINGSKVHVLASHAPTEEDSLEAHSLFAAHMQEALNALDPHEMVIIGCDLNAKVKGLDLKLVGEQAISHCRYGASHRFSLLSALDAKGFRLVNTFFGSDSDYTWRHPNGSLSQIDFVIASNTLMDRAHQVTIEEWGYFDLATASDHRAVSALFDFGAKHRPAKQASLPRFANDAHYAAFAERCRTSPFAPWDGQQDPAEYITELVKLVADDILATKPKKDDFIRAS